jgi:hypothetical protein
VIIGGRLVEPLPSVDEIREHAQANLKNRPPGPRRTDLSPALEQLAAEFRSVHVLA